MWDRCFSDSEGVKCVRRGCFSDSEGEVSARLVFSDSEGEVSARLGV